MLARRHEIELLLLVMFAALPLYATQTVSTAPLIVFHLFMTAVLIRVARGKTPDVVPPLVMKALGVGYIGFYIIDLVAISREAIAASTHLALFIAAYQPIEGMQRNNRGQRLLAAAMLFVASIATSTHIAILPFVVAFAFLVFRQFILMSHDDSIASIGVSAPPLPAARAAGFYVAATGLVAVLLFPMLPRVRNPFVPGMAGALGNASTGLSDSIDFREPRSIATDATVVSRVWMSREAVPFFTPLRLKGTVYDRFHNDQWMQSDRGYMPVAMRDGTAQIARPNGFTRSAQVQQRLVLHGRLLLPVGTYAVNNAGQVYEGPRDVFFIYQIRPRESITYDVRLARSTTPRLERAARPTNYPVTPRLTALARQIVGNERDPLAQAGAIEHYLSTRFQYVANPAQIGHAMSVDEFLLRDRRGHCEYFAAGMVALLTSLNAPARIVGGFYGGQLNPLTGYFVVRREDAHAWVEVWNGKTWQTFDPTPASLRPGNAQAGLLKMYATAVSDSINYYWDRYVLTFGLGDQLALVIDMMERMRDSFGMLRLSAQTNLRSLGMRQLLRLVIPVVVIAVIIVLFARRRRSLFKLLAARLRDLGIEVGPAMTMEEALAQLRATRPDAAEGLAPLIALYEEEEFSPTRDRRRAATVRRRLGQLSRTLSSRT
jgi:transglutaminase-like putative cysteine protease